jgi:catalase
VKISGADPDFHRRDLWEAIEAGAYPEYELGVQIFSEEQAEGFSFDVLDATKIVPEELVPVIPVGRLVLNRNPDNFFAETEQVAFCVAHVVPGIDFSNDPLLAGRIHSYVDTQISRLGGPNFHEIPINAPIAQVPQQPARRHAPARQSTAGRVALRAELARRRLSRSRPTKMGYVSFPEPRLERLRTRSAARTALFADHYTQAPLSGTGQTDARKAHIVRAFRFELSRVQTAAIASGMVSSLGNVASELAEPWPGPRMRVLPADAKVARPDVDAGGDRVAGAVAVRAPGDGVHRAPRRDPGGRRLRRCRRAGAGHATDHRGRGAANRRPVARRSRDAVR